MTYLQPLTLSFLLLMAAGLYGLRRYWRSTGWRIAAGGLLGMATVSWPPTVAMLAQPLTFWYREDPRPAGYAEAIVVLSGSVDSPTRRRPFVLAGRDTYRRVMHAAWLYRNWRPLPILATGGADGDREPAAVSMRRLLEQEGVPPADIWTEERSQSTYENAVYGARSLRAHGVHRIALVVEADSMLRAEMCFRKQGMSVTPAPLLDPEIQLEAEDLIPGWKGTYRAEILLHEGLGLIWYRVRGWI